MNVVFAEPLKVVSYNVENLFYPERDSLKDDSEWTPEGERRWSYTRYYRKVENIARVLTNIGEWDGVDIVGLQEVENALCVKRLCYTLRRGEYDFVHYESPDARGIDVALIYKKSRVDTIATRAIKVKGERVNGERLITRDILYVCAQIDKRDTVHFFVCHLPSQRGGKAESEWKRRVAKEVLEGAIDSVYLAFRDPKIIVMGDFNREPKEDIRGVKNKMIVESQQSKVERPNGTHKYQGRWTCLDHFYTSPSLDSLSRAEIYNAAWIQEPDEKYLDLKPKRTYNGFRYQKEGFSDHLPIVLTVSL
ncbi:MAG: endonuclease/exonuclease/phosphatase family protein [Bacteroidales bacterium]|nr:endonuclease/exonuclease/phosphatase family protein [Bacteroidales bacterium]